MAFGTSTSNVAGADVEFRAETGKFEADVAVAKRIYTEAVGQMSDASLRMSVAQEKLDRAISKFGPESLQARSAAVAYRKELNAVQEQADHTTRSVRHTNNEMLRAGRGAIAASGAFKGLGNALFFASSSFAGAFGIIYALRAAIKEAALAQVVMAGLAKAVGNAGLSWADHRKAILAALEAQSKLSAFDDEELKASFSTLIIRTKDVNQALALNAIAADVARARNTTLEQAVTLVTRASLGQVASLRRLGLDVARVTTAQDKLRAAGVKVTFQQREQAKASDVAATRLNVVAALQEKFAGRAAAFAETAAGAQERFNKVFGDTKEIIGTALLPTITELLTRLGEWLDKSNKTGELQRKMNQLLRDGGTAAHILAEGLKTINAVVSPLVRNVGGLQNALELAIGIKLILALRRAMISFGLMGAASGVARTKIVADSAAEVVALNGVAVAAGRAAAVTGAIGVGGIGGGRGLLGRVGGRLALAGLGFGPITGAVIATWAANDFADARDAKGHAAFVAKVMAAARKGALTPDQIAAIQNAPSWAITEEEKKEILRLNGSVGPETAAGRKGRGGTQSGGTPSTESTVGGATGGTTKRTEVDIQLDLSRARARGDVSAEARADRELLALYKAQAANLERRKNLTLLQKQKLQQLYGQIASTQSELDGIAAEAARKDQASAQAAAQAQAKQRAARKQRLDTREQQLENALLRAAATKQLSDDGETARALIAFYRGASRNEDLTAKERAQYDNKRLKVLGTLRGARSAAIVKRLDLKELRLENAVDRAELTETLADDRKWLRLLIAFFREMAQNEDLSAKARADYEKKRIAARKRQKDINKQDAGTGGKGGLTGEQVRSMQFEFLTKLTGEIGQYGSNFQSDSGQIATQAHVQTSLLRDTNAALQRLVNGTWHAGAQLASAELSAAGWGVGF